MGPRKRSKLNPESEASLTRAQVQQHAESSGDGMLREGEPPSRTVAREPDTVTISNGSGSPTDGISIKSRTNPRWYTSTTWPRVQKAGPSIQVAKETILASKSGSTGASVDLSRFESKREDNAPLASTSRLPIATKRESLHETANVTNEGLLHGEQADLGAERFTSDTSTPDVASAAPVPPSGAGKVEVNSNYGWLGWLRYPGTGQRDEKEVFATSQHGDVAPTEVQTPGILTAPPVDSPATDTVTDVSLSVPSDEQSRPWTASRSWLPIWAATATSSTAEQGVVDAPGDTGDAKTPVPAETSQKPEPGVPRTGSSWAFWSRDGGKPDSTKSIAEESGELAVEGESSQSSPILARAEAPRDISAGPENRNKRTRPVSNGHEGTDRGDLSAANKQLPSNTTSVVSSDLSPDQASSPATTPNKSTTTNLLLPSVKDTYRLTESPSMLQHITRLFLPSHNGPPRHVFLSKDHPKIRKALAIGIHGLFPAPFLRTVIGQPTGTSIRFANHAADAISRWTTANGYECDIEKVALEGEGRISERVDSLWKLLLNWIDHVRNADFILVACHSQGVPVAVMLVAKLIEFGVVSSTKIGVCAMAGVSLGPFAEYKSRFLSGSAAELYEFANPESDVSKRYESSLRASLAYGVRITFVGSLDDQLVSLESAVFSPISHPYVYRAVFVDGRIHASDFIAHLVGLVLKLRNLGVSDHGMIRELSSPLAGSLYSGEGHSRLYDETAIYDMAISFTLETTSIGNIPMQVNRFNTLANSNPFQLPWSMRGILEEELVKTELHKETIMLLQRFDEWKPTSKALKDVKYRLEAVRSKL